MRVSDVMTRDLVTLPPGASVGLGLSRAQEHDLHHMLIAAERVLTGLVCVCDLRERPSDHTLESCIARPPDVIAPELTIDEAVEAFIAKSVSCFPVCEGRLLVGVVTRSDLLRSVVPEARLPASFTCTFCGSTRHIRPLNGHNALAACLECTDRSVPTSANLYDEGTKG